MNELPTTAFQFHVPSISIPRAGMVVVLTVLLLLAGLLFSLVFSYLKRLFAPPDLILSAEQAKIKASMDNNTPGLFSHLAAVACITLLAGLGYFAWAFCNSDRFAELQNLRHPSNGIESALVQSILAGKPFPGEGPRFTFAPKDMDEILQHGVVIDAAGNASGLDSLALVRTGFAVAEADDSLIVAEIGQWLKQQVLIEYHFPNNQGQVKITANGLPVTGYIAKYLWSRMSGQLNQAFLASPLASQYKFLGLGTGGLVFERSQHAK